MVVLNTDTLDYISKNMASAIHEKLKGPICAGEPLTVAWPAIRGAPGPKVVLSWGDVRRCQGATLGEIAALVRKRLESS